LVDARRDFSELRVTGLTPAPVAPARSFEPRHGPLESFNRRFELGHARQSGVAATVAV
jgi:hypothetical protein